MGIPTVYITLWLNWKLTLLISLSNLSSSFESMKLKTAKCITYFTKTAKLSFFMLNRPNTCTATLTPLTDNIVDDVLFRSVPDVNQWLFDLDDVPRTRLVDAFLYYSQNSEISQTKIPVVGWPHYCSLIWQRYLMHKLLECPVRVWIIA